MRRTLFFALAVVAGCRATYPAPEPRTVAPLGPTQFGAQGAGDVPAVNAAEHACQAGLSSRAVSAAFRAVDEVADAVSELCTIEIVDDDPLVWHVWCGSDALFQSGHYVPPASDVSCEAGRARTAFECIGRILARHLLGQDMAAHVEDVEIVSIGSVDRQRVANDSEFLTDPCVDLQRELGLSEDARWAVPDGRPSDDERRGVWNTRLSWCRAAFSAQQLRAGMSRSVGSRYELGAVGAGTDWLSRHAPCPTPVSVSGERGRGQCRDARRVDVFVRVRASEGRERPDSCTAPGDLPGEESGRALYCWSDCQAHAAIGRNPSGYRAPSSRDDLLFGGESAQAPRGWIVERAAGNRPINARSVRQLLLQ
jgi:hypothetical protein